jgi:hypothetical protein
MTNVTRRGSRITLALAITMAVFLFVLTSGSIWVIFLGRPLLGAGLLLACVGLFGCLTWQLIRQLPQKRATETLAQLAQQLYPHQGTSPVFHHADALVWVIADKRQLQIFHCPCRPSQLLRDMSSLEYAVLAGDRILIQQGRDGLWSYHTTSTVLLEHTIINGHPNTMIYWSSLDNLPPANTDTLQSVLPQLAEIQRSA